MSGPRIFLRVFLALVLLGAVRAEALEVRQVLWGFDGRVVPGRFNHVSVLVANPGNGTFDGPMTFAATLGFGGTRGAAYVQPVFVGPQGTRWVQFDVFIGSGSEEFSLIWGPGAKERETFDRQLPTGPPACVWLVDVGDAFARPGAFKAFPDQLFPTTVAATDALDAVILDYVPRWEPARRDAFLDWLRRGGTVHLVHGAGGELPVFTETLAVLNGDGETTRVGAGQVVRHRMARAELRPETLTARGFPPREVQKPQDAVIHNFEDTLYQRLSSLTRPKVKWWLLNVLTFLYIAVIGPVAWRTARRMDYRWAIGGFLGVVAAFGLAFGIVGRRGYGESQTVHSLSIARSLGGGRWDVTQWLSAFATSSGQYTLTHTAEANLYATASSDESARGQILNGKGGRFLADIPLYSSRSFTHRGVMQGDDLGVVVEKWRDGQITTISSDPSAPEPPGGLLQTSKLRLKPGPQFPQDAFSVAVVRGDRIYTLRQLDGGWETTDSGETIAAIFSREKLQPLSYGFNNYGSEDTTSPATRTREMVPLLQARALGSHAINTQFPERPLAPNQLRLLVAAPAPAGFHMQGQGFGHENGVVLYVQDISQP